jgi:hypothetical protein
MQHHAGGNASITAAARMIARQKRVRMITLSTGYRNYSLVGSRGQGRDPVRLGARRRLRIGQRHVILPGPLLLVIQNLHHAKENDVFRRSIMTLVLCGLPGLAFGQASPERFLPAASQVYLRWDGVEKHRKGFEQTAVGKMLQGDTGTFLSSLSSWLFSNLENLAAQNEPQAARILKELPPTLAALGRHGFVLGVELRQVNPPQLEAAVVFPKTSKEIVSLLSQITEQTRAEIKEIKVGGLAVRHIANEGVHLAWWAEGEDAVILFGTEPPEAEIKRLRGKAGNLTAGALYKQVKSFKEFPAWGAGYVDVAALIQKVKDLNVPGLGQLLDDLGLDGLKNITFHSGFEGSAERAILEVNLGEKRRGLLSLLTQQKLTLADLPPMPDDLTSFSANKADMSKLYDVIVGTVEGVVRIVAPNEAGNVKEAIKALEGALGIKLGEDVLAHLGDMYVQYNSPADGPLTLGSVSLIKVKDAKKLEAGLESLIKALANVPGLNATVHKRSYRGVDIHQVDMAGPGNFTSPAFAVHKGWLAISNYPQPIKGFILRSGGELPAWKADKELSQRLAKLPKDYTGIAISDPRPSMRFLLSVTPAGLSLLNSVGQFMPGFAFSPFDVSLVPNAHEATRHLFPNITIITDDGKKIRCDTRASLALPF